MFHIFLGGIFKTQKLPNGIMKRYVLKNCFKKVRTKTWNLLYEQLSTIIKLKGLKFYEAYMEFDTTG